MGKQKSEQSRNVWINKDEPKDVSTLAHYKDGYEDILEPRRHSSDVKYCVRTRKDVPQYKYNQPRSPADIKTHVIRSDRVQYVIEQISSEKKIPQATILKEAQEILDEMAHDLDVRAVRSLAFALMKIFKALFQRIYVNVEGIKQMRSLIQEYPVILMPTHRSYMDFLLVSYIFYHYDLPLPVIMAAMDFKGMKFVGWLLSKCGAFYIRRAFGTDTLYWAIFTEYVQIQLRNGSNPVEFFVEGTRSRTAKSYVPKIGTLSATLESYFKAEVPDLMIVPISISYDRILEETLYAYELLGIPKPKESTSGLFKAASILSEDFGSIHFHLGEPVSVRQLSTPTIDRGIHGLEPRYINNLTSKEASLAKDMAYGIVLQQQHNLVVCPWSLMATVLMQNRVGIPFKQLMKEVDWLKRQAYSLGGSVDWPGNASLEAVIRHYLSLHTNVIDYNFKDADDSGLVELKLVRPKDAQVKGPMVDEVMLNAATNLVIASYRNQLLHVFVRVGLVALAVNSCDQDTMSKNDLYEQYCFLEKLLSRDFIFMPGETRKAFDYAVLSLSHSGGLVIQDNIIQVKKSINKHTTFFSQMFEPFLVGYWVVCVHLLSLTGDVHGRPLPKKPKDLSRDAQKLAITLVRENMVKHYEVLSLDILGNGLNALADLGCMYRDKRNDETWLSPNNIKVSHIAKQIDHYIDVPRLEVGALLAKSKSIVMSSKL